MISVILLCGDLLYVCEVEFFFNAPCCTIPNPTITFLPEPQQAKLIDEREIRQWLVRCIYTLMLPMGLQFFC